MADYRDMQILAKWNMDDAICKVILALKTKFITDLKSWNLQEAYWDLQMIVMEVEAKFRPEEQRNLIVEMDKLEKLRIGYARDKKLKGEFFMALKNLNRDVNRLMKKHGIYFREGDDPSRAVVYR